MAQKQEDSLGSTIARGQVVLGSFLLFALTMSAFFAAAGLAVRAGTNGRAELIVATSLCFFAIVGTPIFVLGYLQLLYRPLLAVVVVAIHFGIVTLSARRWGWRHHLGETAKAIGTMVRAPIDAVRTTWNARSVATLGVIAALAVIATSFWFTYAAPLASWDGFFYHEPIVGFAIQNHGFRVVDLPQEQAVQATNGYPRFCECISLWFVYFSNKTWIEIPNTLATPGFLAAAYLLARRFADRAHALGWIGILILIPAAWTQLCTSYIDIQLAFFLVAATHYATRSPFRFCHAVLSLLALAMVMAAKSSALAWVPPLLLITFAQLFVHHPQISPRQRWTLIAIGTLGISGIAALTLVRNWIYFDNPIWPIHYSNSRFGVKWHGLITLSNMAPSPPLGELLEKFYKVPEAGIADLIHRSYGYAFAWVILPVAAVALVCAVPVAVAEYRKKQVEKAACRLLVIALPCILSLKTTPSLEIARYNLHIVVSFVVAICWLLRRGIHERLRESVLGAALLFSIAPLFWTGNWYWAERDEWNEHLRQPWRSTTSSVHATFDRLAAERERELGDGDHAAFTDGFLFVGALWNSRFSNHVTYVRFAGDNFVERVGATGAKWIAVPSGGPARTKLEATGEWKFVGTPTSVDGTVVLRHVPIAKSPEAIVRSVQAVPSDVGRDHEARDRRTHESVRTE